ncbi:PREDICTED: uncharacterized protein LOC104793464 isoform X2 [Camelina sativa]|uniref:Uncharacterized protein LOC104739345 isoform X2 n=1 Tax=Camelina sativa TaxID=90675 RepID=A0ABM0VLD5_CAMSA|nr:PREDICTED: uncharacterized protein LOC104739345 isoform X2 [Camelina sativa]XP_019082405.1 PREDICTED: uncharacterized protein LOC104793464 isoform X2 [Camelina sativa]
MTNPPVPPPNFNRNAFLQYMSQQFSTQQYSSSTPEYDTFYRPIISEDQTGSIPDFETNVSPPADVNGSVPPADANGSVPPVSVEDLLIAPGRETLKYLHPKVERGAIWFKRDPYGVITKSILRMQKTDVKPACLTYRSLPPETKKRWFQAFAQEFNWDPIITKIV